MIKKLLLLLTLFSTGATLGWSQGNGGVFFEPSSGKNTIKSPRTDESKLRIGYTEDRVGGTLKLQWSDQPVDQGAAVLLKKEIVNKYAGNTLTDIVFYQPSLEKSILDAIYVFVTPDLDMGFSNFPLKQKVENLKENAWNVVTLQREIPIEADKPLYIGIFAHYSVGNFPAVQLSFTRGARESGANFFLGPPATKWDPLDRFPLDYNIAIFAYAKGDNAPLNDVGIRRLESSDFVSRNTPSSVDFCLRNYSKSNVKKVTFSLKSDGKEFQQITVDTLNLPIGLESFITMGGIKFPEEGNHTIELDVLTVNEKLDSNKGNDHLEKNLFVFKEGGSVMSKKVLFEQFTSERHRAMPEADSLYAVAINKRKDVVWIKHHLYEDTYSLPYTNDLSVFFENNKTFLPAIAINRDIYPGLEERGPAYFVGVEGLTTFVINNGASFPAFISVNGELKLDKATNRLDIRIKGESAAKELPFAKEPRLTVLIVEDSIKSTTQLGKKEYIQNGVVRAILNASTWGDKLDLSSYNYQKDYTLQLDSKWNRENLRVVAFVNDYGATPKDLRVHNAAEFSVKKGTSNEGILADIEAQVWYSEGIIQATKGFEIVAVYDLSGRRIASSNLSSGYYVVQLTDGHNRLVRKLLVK
ncbi:Omp28-related outer membrane protein [Porphyromonas gingivicanis]|uniref:Omp28-related outer membrane protein n=1 Tax=Porphyromonas gingivicanis TaxID=266762 RepID=UPI0004722AD0|nr:Omp28-related outer membrane protein [Porphyromonas gingivicanis]